MIDVENFTDYEIAEIFCGNVDWPGKNVRLWRNKLPNLAADAPYGHDGRWRWMLYDTDLSLGYATNVDNNFFPAATSSNGGPIAKILSRLLENSDYKKYFLARLADLLNTTLLSSRAVSVLNTMKAQYTPLMPDHIARWKSPASMTAWNDKITAIENFLNQRPGTYRTHVRSFFGPGYTDNNLVINVSDASMGGSTNYKAFFEAGALPVVLKSFTAKKELNKVAISWETTTEINNDYFTVERSANAENWSPIITIKGALTTGATQLYRATDELPLPATNYYRLKQVDLDQTTTFSRIISVDMGNLSITSLWPNPVSDVLNVTIDQSFQQSEYEITDINGTIVSGFQKMSAINAVKIPVGDLAIGTYILLIKNKDGVSKIGKFVKQ